MGVTSYNMSAIIVPSAAEARLIPWQYYCVDHKVGGNLNDTIIIRIDDTYLSLMPEEVPISNKEAGLYFPCKLFSSYNRTSFSSYIKDCDNQLQ